MQFRPKTKSKDKKKENIVPEKNNGFRTGILGVGGRE
jgi:hypothetical protein